MRNFLRVHVRRKVASLLRPWSQLHNSTAHRFYSQGTVVFKRQGNASFLFAYSWFSRFRRSFEWHGDRQAPTLQARVGTPASRQRRLSRRKRGSHRRRKAVTLVAKAHRKIRNQRAAFHHDLSRWLVEHYGLIGVEDLNIKGLSRGILAGPIHDRLELFLC